MSLQVEKYTPAFMDDVSELHNNMAVQVGTETKQIRTFTADSHSPSQTTWRFNTSGENIVMNRRWLLRVQPVVTVEHATASENVRIIPRQYASMFAAKSVNLTVNGTQMSSFPSRDLPLVSRFFGDSALRALDMPTASQPDNLIYSYQTDTNDELLPESPFNDPYLSKYDGGSRNSEKWVKRVGTGASTTREFDLVCPIYHEFLSFSDSKHGLANINTIEVNINWENLLTHFIAELTDTSGVAVASSNVSLSWTKLPQLVLEFYSPTFKIPPMLAFDSATHHVDTFPVGTLDQADKYNAVMSRQMHFDHVPHRLYVAVQPRLANVNRTVANIFADITEISVNYNNMTVTYTHDQMSHLYTMSRNNGLNMPFYFWNAGDVVYSAGAPLCFEFGKDIPLESGVVPGQPMRNSCFVTVSGYNYSGETITFDLVTVYELSQRVFCSPNECSVITGLDNQESTLAVATPISANEKDLEGHTSGSGLKKLRRFGKRAFSKGRRLVEDGLNLAQQGKQFYDDNKATLDRVMDTGTQVQNVVADARNRFGSSHGGLLVGGGGGNHGGVMVGGNGRRRF